MTGAVTMEAFKMNHITQGLHVSNGIIIFAIGLAYSDVINKRHCAVGD